MENSERDYAARLAAELQEARDAWQQLHDQHVKTLYEDGAFFETFRAKRLSDRKEQLTRSLLNRIYAGHLPKREVVQKKKNSPRFITRLEEMCREDEILQRIPEASGREDLVGKDLEAFEKAVQQKAKFMPDERKLYQKLEQLCKKLDAWCTEQILEQDLEALYKEQGSAIVDLMIQRVLRYFEIKEAIPLRPYKAKSKDWLEPSMGEEVGISPYERMKRRYEEGWLFELVPFAVTGTPSLMNFLEEQTVRCMFPELEVDALLKGSGCNIYRETLLNKLEEEAWEGEFLQDTAEDITLEDIEEALYHNPGFTEMIQEVRERRYIAETMRNMILDQTPDNYADLYPAARRHKRHFVIHVGPTNSGKTYNALQALMAAESGIYLGPLRLMAYEIQDKLNDQGVPCDLLTGEEHIQVFGARHVACTIEMMNEVRHYETAVIDEAQMVVDSQRGGFWTAALLGVNADNVHVCAAPQALTLIEKIIDSTGDTWEVHQYERQTPLIVEKANFSFPQDVKHGDALIVFSRKSVLYVAAELNKHTIKCGIIYGSLPYDVRQEEMRRFAGGDTDVVVATDAIGMGLNLPIRRIVFLETQKFDGKVRRHLLAPEIQQIAGRAGRRGLYEKGFVTSEFDRGRIRRALTEKVPEMTGAVVKFPQSLMQIEGPLSEILERWNAIPANSFYEKGDIGREIELARELEQETSDKAFIYSFITIPFSEKVTLLHDLWHSLFQAEMAGVDPDLSEYNLDVAEEEEDLEYLEMVYQVCDLLYYYMQRFGHDEHLEEIGSIRYSTSRRIMEMIREQGYEGKTCRNCGRPLPWNYPYAICQQCFDHDRH